MIKMKFKLNLPQVGRELDQVVLTVQKRIALQLLDGIVDMTPVDTGRARANWQVAFGVPSTEAKPDAYDQSGQVTKEAGRSTIQAITTLGAIYLTNNLPYITALERGSSRQAPQGMVQVSLDRVGSQLR